MLTFPPPQYSCILRASEPAGIISPSVKLTRFLCPASIILAPNPVLALAGLTSTLAPKPASSAQARIMEHVSSEPVHITPRPTRLFPRHHLRCITRPFSRSSCKSGLGGGCSQGCTSARSNFERGPRNRQLRSISTRPASISGSNLDGADSHNRDIAGRERASAFSFVCTPSLPTLISGPSVPHSDQPHLPLLGHRPYRRS